MPLTDHVPPLTVVCAAWVALLAVSVITTEIESPLSPVPLTVTLPRIAEVDGRRAAEGHHRAHGPLRRSLAHGSAITCRVRLGDRVRDCAIDQTTGVDTCHRPCSAANGRRRGRGGVAGRIADRTTEIESPLVPVPATVTLLALAMLMFGVLVKATTGATVILVSVWVTVLLLPTASVAVTA